jgi:hypothetical protein
MRQGSFKVLSITICLILLAGIAGFPVFGDDRSVDYEAVIIEAFDGDTHHEWNIANRDYSYDFSWQLDASKFTTNIDGDQFPKMSYVPSWPMALFGINRDGKDLKSLGIWGRFDRRGYNWVDVYPVSGEENKPFEIPIPGRLSYIDMWVWGSNLNYYIEAYIRDHTGVVHAIRLGDTAYTGWRNLRAQIPHTISQSKRILPRLAGLTFVKFRIWTMPQEKVENFYIYFDQFKILTDTFESQFDGDELADPDRVQELWTSVN